MTLELHVPFPTPPGLGFIRRNARSVWSEATRFTDAFVTFARALPSIAVSLERLAELQDELEALGKLDLQLERLADLQDELATLGRLEGALEQIAKFGTPLDNLTEPVMDLAVAARSLPDLAVAATSLPALVEQVKGVETIVAHMDARIDELVPMLDKLVDFGGELGEDIDELGDALAPISQLAGRLPGARKRAREAEKEKAATETP